MTNDVGGPGGNLGYHVVRIGKSDNVLLVDWVDT